LYSGELTLHTDHRDTCLTTPSTGSKPSSKRNSHSEGADGKIIDANFIPVLLEKQLTKVEANHSEESEDVFPDGGLQVG
jgi:hypothetical protein